MIPLWVCHSCDVLLGIDVIHKDTLKVNCASCGIKYDLEEIPFLNKDFIHNLIRNVENDLPEKYHQFVRYRWLSNKTVGILIDYDEQEILDDLDIYAIIEDDIAEQLDLFITLDFE